MHAHAQSCVALIPQGACGTCRLCTPRASLSMGWFAVGWHPYHKQASRPVQAPTQSMHKNGELHALNIRRPGCIEI